MYRGHTRHQRQLAMRFCCSFASRPPTQNAPPEKEEVALRMLQNDLEEEIPAHLFPDENLQYVHEAVLRYSPPRVIRISLLLAIPKNRGFLRGFFFHKKTACGRVLQIQIRLVSSM